MLIICLQKIDNHVRIHNGAFACGGSTIGDYAEIGTNADVAGIQAKIIKIRDEESNSR